MVQGLVGEFLLQRQFLAAWCLGRHEDLDLGQRKRQEAQILQQPAPRAGKGEGDEQGIHSQDIFDGVVLFLATLTVRLCSRVLGADDAPFRPVVGTRGDAGATAGTATTGGGSSASGVTTVAASASVTPSRWARAVRKRAGASPRVRSAARRAGRRTWIH